jgi:hypothetical protein
MNSDFFFKYFYAGIIQSNLCWKIHNKYVFRVNIHIFVLKYLVQIQIIQNQFKISEGGKWNSHQMLCVYSSQTVKNYRICPIRIEIIHIHHFRFIPFDIKPQLKKNIYTDVNSYTNFAEIFIQKHNCFEVCQANI